MIQEYDHLVDTCAEVFGTPRQASNKTFIPVGHVSLEIAEPPEAKDMALPKSTAWLFSLYVSWYARARQRVGGLQY